MVYFLYGQKQLTGWGKIKQHLFKINIFTHQFLEKKIEKLNILNIRNISAF